MTGCLIESPVKFNWFSTKSLVLCSLYKPVNKTYILLCKMFYCNGTFFRMIVYVFSTSVLDVKKFYKLVKGHLKTSQKPKMSLISNEEATKRCRKSYPSVQQKAKLINMLEADPELRSGKFSATFTKQRAVERWKSIRDEINSIPGAFKTWEEWRKTWQDMKSKVKKKQAEIRRSSHLTGGGSPPQPLDEIETQVLATISECVLVGHSDSKESQVNFSYISTPGTELSGPSEIDSKESQVVIEFSNFSTPDTEPSVLPTAGPSQRNTNEENVKKIFQGKSKVTAQKKIKASLEVANALNNSIKEKNEYKKEYYKEKIKEMRKQSEALSLIARSLTVRANPYI